MFSLISIIVRAATCMCKERSNDVSNACGVGVCLDHLFRSLRDCCNLEVYLLLHYPHSTRHGGRVLSMAGIL